VWGAATGRKVLLALMAGSKEDVETGARSFRICAPETSATRFWSWSCKNALAVALTPRAFGGVTVRDFSLPGAVCNSRRTHVGCDYALVTANSGLVPMMFRTRVRL
jgi:hypothetical protein